MVPLMLRQYYDSGARQSMVSSMPNQYYDSGLRKSMVPLMHDQYCDSGAMKSVRGKVWFRSYMDRTWIPIWILYGSRCGSYANEIL